MCHWKILSYTKALLLTVKELVCHNLQNLLLIFVFLGGLFEIMKIVDYPACYPLNGLGNYHRF